MFAGILLSKFPANLIKQKLSVYTKALPTFYIFISGLYRSFTHSP